MIMSAHQYPWQPDRQGNCAAEPCATVSLRNSRLDVGIENYQCHEGLLPVKFKLNMAGSGWVSFQCRKMMRLSPSCDGYVAFFPCFGNRYIKPLQVFRLRPGCRLSCPPVILIFNEHEMLEYIQEFAVQTSSRNRTSSSLSKRVLLFLVALFIVANATAGKDERGSPGRAAASAEDGVSALDADEASHLTFMREEEKLARDVYLTFAEMYPEQAVFSTIATKSEQTHTDTLRDRLDQFNLPDPNPDTNNLPDSLGVFSGAEWGWYFNEKFSEFTSLGTESELAALYVGAFIEELDMNDIADCPQVMVEAGYRDPCGLRYTDETALINAYRSLIDGSENHLRAYVGQIEAVIGVGNYEAQYLTQEEVDVILGR